MGLHFKQSYYNGVANCRDFWGKKFWLVGIENERKNCSAVDLTFTSHIIFRFEITIKMLYVTKVYA